MDRRSSARGFTLAELLIVVAIIAVLVAIAIPVFNSQLEKSREATDLANVRSAYAEVMTAAITEDKTATCNGAVMYDNASSTYKAVVSPLAQKQDGWATSTPITIGGVTSGSDGGDNADKTWIGKPKASGSCTITYNPATAKVTIDWNGSGGGSGSGGSGGDAGSGGSAFDKLTKNVTELTDQEVACVKGNVYKFEGKYYVCVIDGTKFINNQYTQQTPTKNYTQQFRELSSSAKVNSDADLEDVYHDGGKLLRNPVNGQLYSKDGKYYIYTNSETFSYPAPPGGHWVEINYSAK